MRSRFARDISKKDFDCYDCRGAFERGTEMAWDNSRNCRLCIKCLKRLEDLIKQDADNLAVAGAKPRWNAESHAKPWEIEDWYIEGWPLPLQNEYYLLEKEWRVQQYSLGVHLHRCPYLHKN